MSRVGLNGRRLWKNMPDWFQELARSHLSAAEDEIEDPALRNIRCRGPCVRLRRVELLERGSKQQ